MKRIFLLSIFLALFSISFVQAQAAMPEWVLRAAQEINTRNGADTIDLNNVGWDWRQSQFGDFDPLSGCLDLASIPASSTATGFYRVFFDSDHDKNDDWVIIVYNDYSYFGFCATPKYSCDELAPRLTIGTQARVIPGGASNNLRSVAGQSGDLLGEIPANAVFTVLDGPQCSSDVNFWQVNFNGSIGWTAEGQGSEYWLEPMSLVSVAPTAISTALPAPTIAPTIQCVVGMPARLQVGRQAQVTPGLPNNVRARPGESAAYVGEILPQIPFDVIGGPQCASGMTWWQVKYNSISGWTAEGKSADDYWLEPLNVGLVPLAQTNAAQFNQFTSFSGFAQAPVENLFINDNFDVIASLVEPEDRNLYFSWQLTDPNNSQNLSWTKKYDEIIQFLVESQYYRGDVLAMSLLPSGETLSLLVNRDSFPKSLILGKGTTIDNNNTVLTSPVDVVNITAVAFSPSGKQLVLAPQGQGISVIDIDSTSASFQSVVNMPRLLLPNEKITKIKFSADSSRFAALSDANNLVVYSSSGDMQSWNSLYPILTEATIIKDFAIGSLGGALVISGVGNFEEGERAFIATYFLSDTAGLPLSNMQLPETVPSVDVISYSPDAILIVYSAGNELHIIDSQTFADWRPPVTLTEPISAIAFNADGSLMATGNYTGTITIWRVS